MNEVDKLFKKLEDRIKKNMASSILIDIIVLKDKIKKEKWGGDKSKSIFLDSIDKCAAIVKARI